MPYTFIHPTSKKKRLNTCVRIYLMRKDETFCGTQMKADFFEQMRKAFQ